MDRFQRIAEFWQWLPAFRAAAESEHLPTAARVLCVTPSALSRAIRQLENALGRPLFERTGGRLTLTPDGADLLSSVRDAMRRVDDALVLADGDAMRGSLRIAASGTVASAFLERALNDLLDAHDGLSAQLAVTPPDDVPDRLRTGELDVAFQVFPATGDGLLCRSLGEFSSAVFAHPAHALADGGPHALETVAEHAFVGPPHGPDGIVHDGWPADGPRRRFRLHVDQLRVGCDACAAGHGLAVLPRALVTECALPLREVPTTAPLANRPVFALRREPLGDHVTAVDRVIEAVGDAVRRAP